MIENHIFNHIGYFKEYYIGSKFIGMVVCEKDRDVIGYNGKITETLEENLYCTNKRFIKKGTVVTTLLYPLCGKILDTYRNQIQS